MKFKYIFPIIACGAMLGACSDDFLENKPQGVISEDIINSPESIDLLVNAAYASLNGKTNECGDPWTRPTTNWSFGEVRGDNAYKGGGGEGDLWDIHAQETFQVQPNNGNLDGKWFNLYSQISRVHAAMRVLNAADPAVVKNRDIRLAEMKVLRSHYYFELVRLFNRVPYIDENLPTGDYVNVRNDVYTRDEHLARIAGELLEAAEVLPDRQDEVGHVNGNIARAYAAKVKLYQAYEQDPATNRVININKQLLKEVVELIDNVKGYSLLSDFQNLDLLAYENGSESVWAVQHSLNDGSADGGRINWSNLLNSPGGESPYGGDGFFQPSQDLINAYQTDADGLPVFDYQSRPDFAVVKKFEEVKDANGNNVKYDNGKNVYKFTMENMTPAVDPRLDFIVGRPTITYKTYRVQPCGLWTRDRGTYGYNTTKRFWVSPESPDMYQGWPWGASGLNWQIIRYADLMLWKAEALIEIGEDLETARTLINAVRQRAMNSAFVKDFDDPAKDAANYNIGLYPATGWNQDYARKALRTEMRLEKALEGERYFDLVRWGIAREVMTRYFEAEKDTRVYYKNAKFDDGEEYFPIPVAQYNFSLGQYVQNPGYPSF